MTSLSYLPSLRSKLNTNRHPFINGDLFVSHIVTVKTRLHDITAIAAACQRLNLPAPVHGTAKLFSAEATGLLVLLPGWQYPAIIDTASGEVQYDNFGGRWGSQEHLDRFLQTYAVEMCRIQARRKGYTFTEQALQDGSIRIQITEGT
jgi:hypothetical protein